MLYGAATSPVRGVRRSGGLAFRGLTLIELVAVLAILAALAGLVIPQIAMLGRQTDMAVSAGTQADLASNIQYFFIQQKRYPTHLDSLLESTSAGTPTGLYDPEFDAADPTRQVSGLPSSGPDLWKDLEMFDLAAAGSNYMRSLSRSGFDFLVDHDRTVRNSNNSAVFTRQIVQSATSFQVARVKSESPVAKGLLPTTNGIVPSGTHLVAFGIGPRNSAIGKTIANAPIYPGCDGTYYGRYVAVFAVYDNGSRANLIGVVDSYGRYPDYTIQQYNEALPQGARRG